MAYKHERTDARKNAAQVLYGALIRDKSASDMLSDGEVDCLDASLSDYALSLIEGVQANMDELNERLSGISKNWPIDRMPLMDLTILRIALFEMLFVEDVPISVSINEAVELAKSFGGEDDSHRFVNGILGRVARELEGTAELEEDSLSLNADVPDSLSAEVEDD